MKVFTSMCLSKGEQNIFIWWNLLNLLINSRRLDFLLQSPPMMPKEFTWCHWNLFFKEGTTRNKWKKKNLFWSFLRVNFRRHVLDQRFMNDLSYNMSELSLIKLFSTTLFWQFFSCHPPLYITRPECMTSEGKACFQTTKSWRLKILINDPWSE